jgi:uncharacterized protein (TIRG00374 family)
VTIRKTNIVFFAVGISVFAYLISRFGVDQIVRNVQQAGWSLGVVVLIWLVVYVLNTAAWRLVLGVSGRGITFGRLFRITVSGFVINYITPFIALGGEPYKIKALSADLGPGGALPAVVLYRMVHLLGHMFLLLAGIILALVVLDLPTGVNIMLWVSAAVILAVILVTIAGHRGGVFNRLNSLFGSSKRFMRILRKLPGQETGSGSMDEIITHAFRERPVSFWTAVGFEFLSRMLMGVEVYCILVGIGISTTLVSALFLYVAYSVVINVLFFVPLNLGAREGGLAMGLGSLALPPLLGVYLGVIMRIREFVWILIGLGFLLVSPERKKSEA